MGVINQLITGGAHIVCMFDVFFELYMVYNGVLSDFDSGLPERRLRWKSTISEVYTATVTTRKRRSTRRRGTWVHCG